VRHRNYWYPSFELMVPCRMERISDDEIQSHISTVTVNSAASVAVGFKMFLVGVQGPTSRL
jgi:hypothetical protein